MKFLSQIVTIASGSIGGITFTRNRYASLVTRSRVAPVNPQSPRQNQIRNSFSTAVNAWSTLTPAQRAGWEAYAHTVTYQSPVGEYHPTGRDAFIGAYGDALYLANRGLTITPSIANPVVPGALTLDNLDMTSGIAIGTGVKVSASNLANEDFILYAVLSSAVDGSRNYPPSRFLTESLDEVELVAPASGQIEFSGLVEGSKYFARIRAISNDGPHRISGQFILSAVATTSP
jgi:hypothetical protein